MEQFFFVDADSLALPSRKPSNLEQRMSARTDLPDSLHQQRREAFLANRKTKLASRYSTIRRAVLNHKMQLDALHAQCRSRLGRILADAEAKRTEILLRRERECATKVAHAKHVAAAHFRRLAEENARKKAKLDSRLQFVAKRRQALLNVPRSRYLEENLCSLEELEDLQDAKFEAALAIQQWWRRYKMSPLIGQYLKLTISLARAQKLVFDKLVKKIQLKSTIQTTASLFSYIKKMRLEKKSPYWKAPSRTFLSAYMIAAHPEEVMPSPGEIEVALQKTASKMLGHFEAWMKDYTSTSSNGLFNSFADSLDQYFTEFDTWKLQDTKKLAHGMISHWIHLERLWMSVRHQPDADYNWKPKIEEQQKQVVTKITKMGDFAVALLKEAQEDLAKEYEEPPAVESDADDVSLLSTSPERYPSMALQAAARRDSVHSSNAPSRQLTPPKPSVSTAPVEEPIQESTESLSPIERSVPDLTSLAKGFGSDLSSEQLAHELTLDPEFALKPRALHPLEQQIKDMAQKAFLDAAREEFSKGEYKRFLPGMLEDVKKVCIFIISFSSLIS